MAKENRTLNQGQVIVPTGNYNPPKSHEIDVAWIITRHFSCTVEFLIPVDDYKRKTADISIGNIEWEIKSPSGASKTTVHRQFERASKQSKYIVFNGRRTTLSEEILLRRIQKELRERRSIKRLLFITKNSKILEINI